MAGSAAADDVITTLKRLSSAVEGGDAADAKVRLAFLSEVPMTLAILQATKAGLAVNKLCKHENADVASAAKDLTAKWRRVAEAAGARKAEATPLVRTHSAESAVSAASASSDTASSRPATSTDSAKPSLAATSAGAIVSTGKIIADLPAARQKIAAKFRDVFVAAVKGQIGVLTPEEAAAAAAESASPLPSPSPLASSSSSGFAAGSTDGSSAAGGAGASASSSSSEGDGVAVLFEKQTETAVAAQAEAAAVELESAIHSRTRVEARPETAYAERFRALAMGLHNNGALALSVYRGLHPWAWVAGLTSDELASEEHRKAVDKARAEYAASVELDWKKKNRAKTMAALGYRVEDGIMQCGKCKSRNTDFREQQTRSADEPTTKFCECYDCGHKWKFC